VYPYEDFDITTLSPQEGSRQRMRIELMEQRLRNKELQQSARYSKVVRLYGLRLAIDRDVFSPAIGYTSKLLARVLLRERAQIALDMGSGCLFLALILRKAGVPQVWAVDNHGPAIACCRKNLENNKEFKPIEIVRSDLFERIPGHSRFEIIVFNQPYYPIRGKSLVGLGADGGFKLVFRFLEAAPRFLSPGGRILMPWSTVAGIVNDPARVARMLGWRVRVVEHVVSKSQVHKIYELKRAGDDLDSFGSVTRE
jgi:methylase of polypeptide subunit release factors